jgi:hypothetical protein
MDFCVGNFERQAVTCSEEFTEDSHHISRNNTDEQAMADHLGMEGIWPSQSSIFNMFDAFLVVIFASETCTLAMNSYHRLEGIEIQRFVPDVQFG